MGSNKVDLSEILLNNAKLKHDKAKSKADPTLFSIFDSIQPKEAETRKLTDSLQSTSTPQENKSERKKKRSSAESSTSSASLLNSTDKEQQHKSKKRKKDVDVKESTKSKSKAKGNKIEEEEEEKEDIDEEIKAVIGEEDEDGEQAEEEDPKQGKKTRKRKRSKEEEELEKQKEARTVFIGNLPLKLGLKELKKRVKELMKPYGEIESIRFRSITFSNPKLPKKANAIKHNFHPERDTANGYVVFATEEEAQKATAANNSVLEGKHLRVDLAGKPTKLPKLSVFVGNLPFNVSEESLREHFQQCGTIINVRVVRDKQYAIGKGFAFVTFEDKEGVRLALSLNGSNFQDRKLRVFKAHKKPKQKKQTVTDFEQRFQDEKKSRLGTSFQGKTAEEDHIPLSLKKKKRKSHKHKK